MTASSRPYSIRSSNTATLSALAPIVSAVFLGFLAVSVPLAAIAIEIGERLDYAAHGWTQAGTALFGFGAAYVLARFVASGLPDRFGAARVAAGSLAFEALGQVLIWSAPTPGVAALGATLTGLGFSLVFPAMGVLATRAVPPEQHGCAAGNFIAFADIAFAVTGPMVGLVTG